MYNVTFPLPKFMQGPYSTATYHLEIMINSLIMVINLLLISLDSINYVYPLQIHYIFKLCFCGKLCLFIIHSWL